MSSCTQLIVVSAWRNLALGALFGATITSMVASVVLALALHHQRSNPRPW